jgi:hypothetical protein
VETQVDEAAPPGEPGEPGEPGPRLARTLAEQERRRRRKRRLVALAVAVVVALVAAGAAWALLRDDGSSDASPRVGTLIGSSKAKGKGTTTTAAGGVPAGSQTPTLAAKPRWPSVIQGRPKQFGSLNDPPPASAGDLGDGFYLWQDFDGWHLWMVGGGGADRVSVVADDSFAKADPVGGNPDVAKATNGFTLARGGAGATVVGVDFNPGYYAKTLVVSVEGGLKLRVGGHRATVGSFYGIQFSAAST